MLIIEIAFPSAAYVDQFSVANNIVCYENNKNEKNHDKHWFDAHIMALNAVSRQHAHNYFRHCGVPNVDVLPTHIDENDEVVHAAAIVTAAVTMHCAIFAATGIW